VAHTRDLRELDRYLIEIRKERPFQLPAGMIPAPARFEEENPHPLDLATDRPTVLEMA
jgi:hypothetical protein